MNKWFYRILLLSIIALFIVTLGFAGMNKFLGGMPDYFAKTFGETFLASFPGLTLSFYLLAIGETLAALGMLLALLNREFIETRAKPFLKSALVIGAFMFLILGFGQRLAGEHSGAANLFFYFGNTLLCFLFVEWVERRSKPQPK